MRGSQKIFRVFGIDVKLHYSWWFVFILLAYALATGFFPHYYEGLSSTAYWVMGIAASLLLFVSVLLHELTHSLVAKLWKIEVESITLFFFGGVASLPSEDMKPWTEFWMALSGPLFSMALGVVFYFIYLLNGNVYVTAITFYLFQLNIILAVFNLLPGYPLDGGRVFRALLQMYFKDIKKATWIASRGGKIVGGALAILGLAVTFAGAWNGLWFVFLGGFLYFIAGLSYEQLIIKEVLQEIGLKKLMKKSYLSLKPETSFEQAIKKYHHYEEDNFMIEKEGKFLGMLDLRKINKLPKVGWKNLKVRNLMIPAGKIKAVNYNESSFMAFKKMLEQKFNMLPVLRKGRVVGVVTKRKLNHYLMLRLKYGFKI